MDNNPIGIFDSGLGGLTVWREIRSVLPGESLLYFGDGKNCPYGNKDFEDIKKFTHDAVKVLISKGAKLIVIACNTATAAAVDFLRNEYPNIPFVGMEPAVKPAVENTKTGVVAVLATEASFKGNHYRRTISRYANGVEIIPAIGTGFVELVEKDMEASAYARETVEKVIVPIINSGADKIVLGCTHYPFLSRRIESVIGENDVEIINSAPAVARRVAQIIKENNLAAGHNIVPRYDFLTNSDRDYLERLIKKSTKT